MIQPVDRFGVKVPSNAHALKSSARTQSSIAPVPPDAGEPRILAVDDSSANLELLHQLLIREGYVVIQARDGEEALDLVQTARPDLVISDVMMPRRNGYELCRAIKSDPLGRLIPVVLITSLDGSQERIRGIDAGADDFLRKPFDPHELRARVRSLLRLKRYTDDLDSADAVIMSLARTVEARDASTEGHCQRLAVLAVGLGRRLGLGPSDLEALERGGVLHDIGKIGVPDAILLKPSRLTAAEFERMKQHTTIGDRLCSELRLLRGVRPIVRHHHERLDGSGYPDALEGSRIPLLAQIMSVVDVYDALTTARPYKVALNPERAFDELMAEAQRGWRDAALITELVALCGERANNAG